MLIKLWVPTSVIYGPIYPPSNYKILINIAHWVVALMLMDIGYTLYMDIFPGKNLSSFKLVNKDLIYWSVLSSSR